MKGIVFTEFLEMVEAQYGYAMVDKIITSAELGNDGAYTATGTYPHHELLQLLNELSNASDTEKSTLLHGFGSYMFVTFKKGYPSFFEGFEHGFEFLKSVDGHIHKEVLKLYPDAKLPSFETRRNGNEMRMIYRSYRRMADFAHGLIDASMHHFGHHYELSKKVLVQDESEVEFLISITA